MPQNSETMGTSCAQEPTALTVANLYNWNSVASIKTFLFNLGDDQTAATNLNYSQDFLKNNIFI